MFHKVYNSTIPQYTNIPDDETGLIPGSVVPYFIPTSTIRNLRASVMVNSDSGINGFIIINFGGGFATSIGVSSLSGAAIATAANLTNTITNQTRLAPSVGVNNIGMGAGSIAVLFTVERS